MPMLGSNRSDALWRLVAFVWSLVAGLAASVVIIIGMVWGIVDVVWQFITNRDGLSSSSRPAKFVKGVITWPIDLQVYAFTGSGRMMWLPNI